MPFMINLVKQIELVSSAAKANASTNKKYKLVSRSILPAGKVQQRNRQSYQRH